MYLSRNISHESTFGKSFVYTGHGYKQYEVSLPLRGVDFDPIKQLLCLTGRVYTKPHGAHHITVTIRSSL